MIALKTVQSHFLLFSAVIVLLSLQSFAWSASSASTSGAHAAPLQRNGQHDFDFSFGTWNMHVSRLLHPFTDSTKWIQLDGTATVHKVWSGKAKRAAYRRKGVGRLLMSALRDAAVTIGIRDVFVLADNPDRHAIKFYEALEGEAFPVTLFSFPSS